MAVPVVVVGVNGHGRSHLTELRRLGEQGRARLAGICDLVPPDRDLSTGSGAVEYDSDLGALLKRTDAEITLVATPIHTHLPLALTALDHGSHLFLEKPPTASLAEFEQLRAAVRARGVACQVGFQSLGASAVPAARELIAEGAIGDVRGISGKGTWVRTTAYYERSAWAGRRRLDGRDVVDGALTNPFAHTVATALALAGAGESRTADIEVELFRAHEIESDDTSCLRLRTASGVPVSIAVTLCAPEHSPPEVVVHGTAGRITLAYTTDTLILERPGHSPVSTVHPRTGLLENLIAHLRSGTPLLCPPDSVAGFMSVLEAVRRAPEPRAIPRIDQHIVPDENGIRRIVTGVEEAVAASAEHVALYSELGLPWAARRTLRAADEAGGAAIAVHRDGAGLDTRLSPRPYLHPVRTLAGTTVTEERPDDHPHHLGAGVAVADVSGVSFWGGRTFTRARGSVPLPNHGHQEHAAWLDEDDGRLVEELAWISPEGRELIREERTAARLDVEAGTWALELATRLRNTSGQELVIGSPATNGRPGAGYGGFFWRAPIAETVPRCFGPGIDGEHALHGSTARWLALAGKSPRGESWTLCFFQPGPVRDPWFLRAAEYPGVGTALAWDRPLPIPAGQEIRRRLAVLVSDGPLGPEAVAGLVDRARLLLCEPAPGS